MWARDARMVASYRSSRAAARLTRAERENAAYRRRLYGHLMRPARTLAGAISHANEAHQLAAGGKTPPALRERTALLPLAAADAALAAELGAEVVRRGKDWQIEATLRTSHVVHADAATEWRNGRAVGYTRAMNISRVTSAAMVLRSGAAVAVALHTERYELAAPAAHRWEIDANGLRLVGPAGDYHPTAAECWAARADACAALVEQIAVNAATRAAEAATDRAAAAELEGVYVCLADSLRGGNCRAGSEAFARRAGLDARAHVPASLLVSAARRVGESMDRVRLALASAVRRHRRECAQGYALLAEHTA